MLHYDWTKKGEKVKDTYGIDIWNTSNLVIQKNTIHDAKWAIRNSYAVGSTYSNLTVTNNTIYNIDHGWFGTDSSSSGTAVASNLDIYGNDISNFSNWDNTANNNHHDGIHLNTDSASTRFTSIFVYNNYIHGDPGFGGNAGFYSFPESAASETGLYIFNNVMVNLSSSHCWANGEIALAGVGTSYILNNTLVANSTASCKSIGIVYEDGSTNGTIENNIVLNSLNDGLYSTDTTSVAAINYNDYFNSSSWTYNGSNYSSLSNWQSGTGFDLNGTVGNPNLNASSTPPYQLSSASGAAYRTGVNLSSICSGQPNPGLGALCSDAIHVARPATGGWDMGAYYFAGGTGNFALIQKVLNSSCPSSSNTCTATVSSTGAGHIGVIMGTTGSGSPVYIKSVAGGGSWSVPTGCQINSGPIAGISCAYNLSLTGGATSITVTWTSSSPGNYTHIEYREYAYSGASVSFDTSSHVNDSSASKSLAGVALSLSGTNDVIVQQLAAQTGTPSSVTTYTDFESATFWGVADLLNTDSGSAPTWTNSASATALGAAIALKGN